MDATESERSPELRAEIARGKLPVGFDPNKHAYDRLLVAFHARQGPFDVIRFRPPSATGGTRGDFMVRLATLKRAIADGDAFLARLLVSIGHQLGDLDRAMSYWRAQYLENGATARGPGGVTATALEA